MTTLTTLDARALAMAETCGHWMAKADALVSAKVADARAHAGRAITTAIRETPDGRATVARARRSRSYDAATHRLDELAYDLVGLVARAREAFYRDAIDWHAKHLPGHLLKSADPVATQADLAWVRGMVLHGTPLITEVATAKNQTAAQLLSTIVQVATKAVPPMVADDMLDAWEARSAKAITQTSRSLLSDSQVLADRKAGRDVVKAEYLDDDPTLPS